MSVAKLQSKVTAQGQISIPAEVRRKLGIGAGSILEWEQRGDEMIVRRAGRYTWADIRQALFGDEKPEPLPDVKEAIRQHVRHKHGRR
jgi:AbrB family looped-hinge helix DNA binding protein